MDQEDLAFIDSIQVKVTPAHKFFYNRNHPEKLRLNRLIFITFAIIF